MIRITIVALIAACFCAAANAQESHKDTLIVHSPETIVTGFPIEPHKSVAPIEHIDAATIKALSTEQDVAKIASITPSATFSSQSGLDIGYTRINIRGVDQNRISVLVNGIPQNGPEDQEVYWIDMPGLQASASAIDVQRGAGTAFYGPPAIGGSINVRTDLSPVRRIVATGSYGSYNTSTYGVEANSGLVYDKYIFCGRLTQTHTDGYRHSSWLDRTPYFVGIARYDSTMTTQFNAYGGPFNDGLNYYGLARKSWLDGPDSLRRYNPSEPSQDVGDNQYLPVYERRSGEGEHFIQPHYELLNEWRIGDSTTLYNTVFYIQGNGYFDIDGTWPSSYYGISNAEYYRLTPSYAARYGFTPLISDSGFTGQIYRGSIDNKQWGWLPRISWKHEDGELTVAGELRLHNSDHYGSRIQATGLPADLPSDYHFYEFRAAKDIGNISALDQFDLSDAIHVSAALQLVNERYRFFDQKPLYVDSAMAGRRNISAGWTSYEFGVPFTFLNPRVGLRISASDQLSFYGSASVTSREPRLTDYYNAEFLTEPNFVLDGFGGYDFTKPVVHPETVVDFEVGTEFSRVRVGKSGLLTAAVNGYYMGFADEIILSNHYDNFGAPVQQNAKSTEHYGIEAELQYDVVGILQVRCSLGLSHNTILALDSTFLGLSAHVIGNAPPGVPKVIANALVSVTPFSWLRLDVIGRYNGGYCADIENTEAHRLDPFFVSDAVLTVHIPDLAALSFIEAKLQMNNVLNRNFAEAATGAGFFPAAPRNVLGTLSIGL